MTWARVDIVDEKSIEANRQWLPEEDLSLALMIIHTLDSNSNDAVRCPSYREHSIICGCMPNMVHFNLQLHNISDASARKFFTI